MPSTVDVDDLTEGGRITVELLEKGVDTFARKNADYGSSYEKIGEILRVLFPDGVELKTRQDFMLFSLLVRELDKVSRKSNLLFTEHEALVNDEAAADTAQDLGVYSFMMAAAIEQERRREDALREGYEQAYADEPTDEELDQLYEEHLASTAEDDGGEDDRYDRLADVTAAEAREDDGDADVDVDDNCCGDACGCGDGGVEGLRTASSDDVDEATISELVSAALEEGQKAAAEHLVDDDQGTEGGEDGDQEEKRIGADSGYDVAFLKNGIRIEAVDDDWSGFYSYPDHLSRDETAALKDYVYEVLYDEIIRDHAEYHKRGVDPDDDLAAEASWLAEDNPLFED